MTSIRNKQRPFRLLKYLYENTDEEHPISTTELVRIFVAEDAHAKRKTVKDDIDVLVGEGFDIVTVRGRNNSFFLGTRKFELPEDSQAPDRRCIILKVHKCGKERDPDQQAHRYGEQASGREGLPSPVYSRACQGGQ